MNSYFLIGSICSALLLIETRQLHSQDLLLEPDKVIKNIHINSKGKLLIQTESEICTYEGINKIADCMTIDKNAEGLGSVKDHTIVLFQDNLLYHYNFTQHVKTDTVPEVITALAFSGDRLYVGTADGLYYIDNNSIKLHPHGENKFINDLHVAENSYLHIATDSGVIIIDSTDLVINHILSEYSISKSIDIDDTRIAALSDEGEILIASLSDYSHNVYRPNNYSIKDLGIAKGQLIAHTSEGLFIWEEDKLKELVSGKIEDFEIHSDLLLIAKQNQLLSHDLIVQHNYTTDKTFNVFIDDENRLWIGQNKKLSIINSDGTPNEIEIISENQNLYISSVIIRDEKVFIGTMGEGLLVLDMKGNQIYKYENQSKENQNNIIQLKLIDEVLWVAYLNGAFTFDPNSLKVLEDHDEILAQNYLYSILPIDKHYFYLGTSESGLVEYNNNLKTSYLEGKSIYSIAKIDNVLFVSTERSGVYRIENNKIERIYNGNMVHSLIPIDNYLIICEKNAISCYDMNTSRLMPMNIDSLYNCQLNGFSENEEQIAIAYENGILRINKDHLPSLMDIRLHLNMPKQYNQEVPESKTLFNHKDNSISFSFHPTSYYNSQSTTYKYRLMGQDSNWIATQQSNVDFYNLNPGNYDFQVSLGYTRDFKPYGVSNYSFTIEPPYWKTNWFRLLVLGSLITLIYLIVKRREKDLIKAQELKQERLTFELEQFKKQIDPHFLFNSFNSLIGLIEENPKLAAIATENLSNFYREITSIKNNDLIELERDLQIARDYFSIQKLRFEELIFLDENIENKKGQVIPLATQALVENAIKHNVINQNSSLKIMITREDDHLIISNKINAIEVPKKVSGHGLNNLSKRYKLLTDKEMLITESDELFTVKIPIINV